MMQMGLLYVRKNLHEFVLHGHTTNTLTYVPISTACACCENNSMLMLIEESLGMAQGELSKLKKQKMVIRHQKLGRGIWSVNV